MSEPILSTRSSSAPDRRATPPRPARGPGCLTWTLIVTLVIVGVAVVGVWGVREGRRRGWTAPLADTFRDVSFLPGRMPRAARPDEQLRVFYVVGGEALAPYSRRLERPVGGAERLGLIARDLGEAPSALYRPPLPEGASIRAVYLLDGIVWVDLSAETLRAGGSPSPVGERLMIYSLVNSFLLNDPTLQGVRILIDGRPAETAWGWMDLTAPLGPDLSLIR